MPLDDLRSVRHGIVFSFFAIIFGIVLGVAFGAAEDSLKASLSKKAEASVTDTAQAKKLSSKAWQYYKRSHLHAGAMGVTALVMCLIIGFCPANRKRKSFFALMGGLGSLGYGFFWLLAGMKAVEMGSTGAAKDSLSWLALPSVGAYTICVLYAFVVSLQLFFKESEDA